MRKSTLKIFVAFCVFMMALTGPAAEGKLITVDDDAPANYTSIQPAINYASNGDLIEVRPGIYNEAINFNGKAIRLYSSGGPEVTTIDATGLDSSVVTCISGEDANPILEGFTITGGNATRGGGMYNDGSSPTVTNCNFSGNSASEGGGMGNENNSNPIVTNCNFSGNSADFGGGMHNDSSSSPTVTNCTFTNNSAFWDGGGMYNVLFSSPTVTNCTFSGNSANTSGGGMLNNVSNPTVTDCIFTGNTVAYGGGGMGNENNSNPIVTNCTFSGNTADYGGGGMGNENNSNPMVTNCTFTGNEAGGGGGIGNVSSSSMVTNCILWGDTPDEIFDDANSTSTVAYSDIQSGWGDPNEPNNTNIDSDPLFLNAPGGDLRLRSSSSPCVDAGDNSAPALPATDLAGNPRVIDGDVDGTAVVDMGAFELQPGQIHNITQDLWYEYIQVSIDDANDGDEIEVAPGTYYEAINFSGKAVRLYSSDGPAVTTIDANGAYHAVQCVSGEDANTILEGFTITGGNANGSVSPDFNGGGMYNDTSSPTVTNCTFSGNSSIYGGGMFNDTSSPTVTNCTFSSNSSGKGAGMFNHTSSPTVTDCNFSGNTAALGGGMYDFRSSPTVTNCTFSGNSASSGGGMYNASYSNPTVTNCTFSSNTADYSGGGMGNEQSSPTVTDCNFSGNSVDYDGGGIYSSDSNPTVTNCNFTCNSADVNGGGMLNYRSSPNVTDCNFSDNTAYGGGGMGNEQSSPTVTDCNFSGNSVDYDGGGMGNQNNSNPVVTNCTFSGNTAYGGGGMGNENNSNPVMTNCTFSGNTAPYGGGMGNVSSSPTVTNCIFWNDLENEIYYDPISPIITYSDIQGGGYPDANNINADPCFIDAASGDFRLKSGSPCIDAGDNTAVPSDVLKDLAGKLRYADDPYTDDAGDDGDTGRPVVDMGAYEFQGCGAIPQNLLANPGFETGDTTGWFTNGDFSLTADTNQVHDGNYSGFASDRTAWWQGACQSLLGLMDDGKTYRISGWVMLQNADSNYVQLTVRKTDLAGTNYYSIDTATGSDKQWVHLDGTLALDINGQPTDLYVYFEGPATDVNFYVDDAAVTEVMGDMDHNGRVDFIDFGLFASYYGFDCSVQNCGRSNFYDCDNAINERDLAILVRDWLVGAE